jgi:hypothetical protein
MQHTNSNTFQSERANRGRKNGDSGLVVLQFMCEFEMPRNGGDFLFESHGPLNFKCRYLPEWGGALLLFPGDSIGLETKGEK